MPKKTRSQKIIDLVNEAFRDGDYDGVDNLEKMLHKLIETKKQGGKNKKIAKKFEDLLNNNPSEEDIQSFFNSNPCILGQPGGGWMGHKIVEGLLPKFPIAPDRIPDFTLLSLALERTQHPNRLSFVELKRPDTMLFSSHNRLSRDLNDAWMECVETQRIVGLNYQDVLRRIVKTISINLLKDFDKYYKYIKKLKNMHNDVPRCSSKIIIGRRGTLDADDMLRIRELGISTSWSIQVATYDSVLENFKETTKRRSDYYW